MDVPIDHIDRAFALEWGLADLTEENRQILSMRFGYDGGTPFTLKQIGTKLKLTRECVRQRINKALMRLNRFYCRNTEIAECLGVVPKKWSWPQPSQKPVKTKPRNVVRPIDALGYDKWTPVYRPKDFRPPGSDGEKAVCRNVYLMPKIEKRITELGYRNTSLGVFESDAFIIRFLQKTGEDVFWISVHKKHRIERFHKVYAS